MIQQSDEIQRDWWRRAPEGSARIFIDYDHHPTDSDIEELEAMGIDVTFRFGYLDTVSATAPLDSISSEGILSLPGVVMIEDLGLPRLTCIRPFQTWGKYRLGKLRSRWYWLGDCSLGYGC